MMSRILAVGAVAAAALLVPPSPAAQSSGVAVSIADMAFTPAKLKVALGDTVTWTNDDGIDHTTTSDQGFWDSAHLSPGSSFAHTFTSAGTFAYHCSIHSMMHGKVKVRISATGSSSSGWTLRWATVKGTGSTTYDVQVRKPGSSAWTTLKSAVTKASGTFNPAAAGTYKVRARTHKGGQTSGWSPKKSLTIS